MLQRSYRKYRARQTLRKRRQLVKQLQTATAEVTANVALLQFEGSFLDVCLPASQDDAGAIDTLVPQATAANVPQRFILLASMRREKLQLLTQVAKRLEHSLTAEGMTGAVRLLELSAALNDAKHAGFAVGLVSNHCSWSQRSCLCCRTRRARRPSPRRFW